MTGTLARSLRILEALAVHPEGLPLAAVEQEGDVLDRLAEAHIVGQAGAEPAVREERQPANAALLVGTELSVEAGWRWQPDMEWAGAGARGVVPEHSTADLALSRRLGTRWEVGLRVADLLDGRHYESFGGDVLARRTLLTVAHRSP